MQFFLCYLLSGEEGPPQSKKCMIRTGTASTVKCTCSSLYRPVRLPRTFYETNIAWQEHRKGPSEKKIILRWKSNFKIKSAKHSFQWWLELKIKYYRIFNVWVLHLKIINLCYNLTVEQVQKKKLNLTQNTPIKISIPFLFATLWYKPLIFKLGLF